MDEQRQKILTVTLFLTVFLIYVNVMFYSAYKLPYGQVDIDRYLYYLGDKDPRIVHDNFNPFQDWRYMVFYNIVAVFGEPRITLLWFPPLIIGGLVVLIYLFYERKNKTYALFKTLVFMFLTYNIWFLFTAGLYRQILATFFLLLGYEIYHRHKLAGCGFVALGILTHIHLLPLLLLVYLADTIHRRDYIKTALAIIGGIWFALAFHLTDGLSILSPNQQPSLYMVFFICTNPFLWKYAIKQIQTDRQSILFFLLLITMPLTDQTRGLFFLHLLLVHYAVEYFTQANENKLTKIALLFLSYLWFNYMVLFLVKSLLYDAINRGLDPSTIMEVLNIQQIVVIKPK